MEQKKSRKADLETRRNTFFLLGLVLALSSVLMAFEWKNKPQKALLQGGAPAVVTEDFAVPIIREHKETLPPPKPKIVDMIEIVDDAVELNHELEIEETEATDKTLIDIPVFVETAKAEKEEEIFVNFIDEPAEFPGGERALYKYISDQVNYPMVALENGVQGKVYVLFVVDENGNIVNARVTRAGDAALDAEALRVINSLPRFKPGKQGGRFVKVYYNAIINFQMN